MEGAEWEGPTVIMCKRREDSKRNEFLFKKIHSCSHMYCKFTDLSTCSGFYCQCSSWFPPSTDVEALFQTGHRMFLQHRNKNYYFIQNVYSLYKCGCSACIKDNKTYSSLRYSILMLKGKCVYVIVGSIWGQGCKLVRCYEEAG